MASQAARNGPSDMRYAPVAVLEAWFGAAQAGDTTIYAIGPALDPRAAASALVRGWIDAGDLAPFKSRHPLTGELLHQVRRTAGAVGSAPSPGCGAVLAVTALPALAAKVLAVLSAAAERGAATPSYTEIAEAAELATRQVAAHQMRKLEAAGLIGVEQDRVVTIVASGRKTAGRVK